MLARLAALPTGAAADSLMVAALLGPVAVACTAALAARLLGGMPVVGPVLITAVTLVCTGALLAGLGAGTLATLRAHRHRVPLGARRHWLAEQLRADLLAVGRPATPACAEAEELTRRVRRPVVPPADPAAVVDAEHLGREVRRLELAGLRLQERPDLAAAVRNERDEVLGRLRELATAVDTECGHRIRAELEARAEVRSLDRV